MSWLCISMHKILWLDWRIVKILLGCSRKCRVSLSRLLILAITLNWPLATKWSIVTSASTRFTRHQTISSSIRFYMSLKRIKRTHKTGMTNDAGYRAAGHWAKWRHWHTFQSTTNTLLSPLLVVGKYLFLKCLFPVPPSFARPYQREVRFPLIGWP